MCLHKYIFNHLLAWCLRTVSVWRSFAGVDSLFRLQDHINIDHLKLLMGMFHLAGTGVQGHDITIVTGTARDARMRRGQLTMMEFRQGLVEILGQAVDTEQMETLFMKVCSAAFCVEFMLVNVFDIFCFPTCPSVICRLVFCMFFHRFGWMDGWINLFELASTDKMMQL